MSGLRFTLCLSLLVVSCLPACSNLKKVNRRLTPPESYDSLDGRSPYLKAHRSNGEVYILSDWKVEEASHSVYGMGLLLSMDRDTLASGEFTVPIDSVAVFETNVVQTSPAVAALTIITGISAAITVACLSNPKACFGSCPTFYAADGGNQPVLVAEGFSSSIAPPLEATDLDALAAATPEQGKLTLEMRNEALETHVVRQLSLFAVPKNSPYVFKDPDDRFWYASEPILPTLCQSEDGDIMPAVQSMDGIEWFSLADSTNLASQQFLELEFPDRPAGQAGLVISARQTLLSTYLLYETLAAMGHSVGRWFAFMAQKRHDPKKSRIASMLGGIEVFGQNGAGEWLQVGVVKEHGPLARDIHMLPFPENLQGCRKVRIKLTRGNWRIDYIGLAPLEGRAFPRRLPVGEVLKQGYQDEDALHKLNDPEEPLVTMPGDGYIIKFDIPDNSEFAFFLESRGYYLEWMRQEWLAQENPGRLSQILFFTQNALKGLASEYKKAEPGMEKTFWRSRYAKP